MRRRRRRKRSQELRGKSKKNSKGPSNFSRGPRDVRSAPIGLRRRRRRGRRWSSLVPKTQPQGRLCAFVNGLKKIRRGRSALRRQSSKRRWRSKRLRDRSFKRNIPESRHSRKWRRSGDSAAESEKKLGMRAVAFASVKRPLAPACQFACHTEQCRSIAALLFLVGQILTPVWRAQCRASQHAEFG